MGKTFRRSETASRILTVRQEQKRMNHSFAIAKARAMSKLERELAIPKPNLGA